MTDSCSQIASYLITQISQLDETSDYDHVSEIIGVLFAVAGSSQYHLWEVAQRLEVLSLSISEHFLTRCGDGDLSLDRSTA